jgi:DNA polymerase-4/DNA polymerase V
MIAHVDADAFFASVLQRKDPRLKGKALLALGMGGGCVIAASYEAKAKGVKTGMPLKEAMLLAPEALRVNSDFRETALASREIESILQKTCPVVEQMSVDEWYLDLETLVGGVPEDLQGWGERLRIEILRRTALSVSVGVGPSKLLAKMAGEYRKPGGVTVIDGAAGRGNARDGRDVRFARLYNDGMPIKTFLMDRPAAAIPGIGRKRVQHTDAHGWVTAWDIASAPVEELIRLFGRPGQDLQRELLGEPVEAVSGEDVPPKSISRCRSFRRTADTATLWGSVLAHLSYTVLKMRRHGLGCRGVTVWLRDAEYHHQGTSLILPEAMDTEERMTPFVRRCFTDVLRPKTAYTQTGLALFHLSPSAGTQYSLFRDPADTDRGEKVQESLDRIRERYGKWSIARGPIIGVEKQGKRGLPFPATEQELDPTMKRARQHAAWHGG